MNDPDPMVRMAAATLRRCARTVGAAANTAAFRSALLRAMANGPRREFGVTFDMHNTTLIGARRLTVTMNPFRYLAACLMLAVWSPAMAVDELPYSVVRTNEAYEVRRIEAHLVAETLVDGDAAEAGNQGFRILAEYIFGGNKGARKIAMTAPVAQAPVKIAMTAPVAQSAGPGGNVVQFAMPREWTLETLPEPNDPRVQLRAVPARTVAVVRYTGTWSQDRYDTHLQTLKTALARDGVKWHGEPVWARYDPPWMPWFMRRNEIWLDLD